MKTNSPVTATLIFTLLTFLQPALNIFLLPVYLQYFPAEDYGILQLMNNITVLVMIIGSLRINASMLTHYFDFQHNRERLADYLGNILSVSLVAGVAFMALMALIGPYLFGWIFSTNQISFYPYGFLAIGIGVLWNFISPYFIFLKNERVLLKYALFYITLVLINIALHLFLIIGLNLGVEGALWAKLLTNAFLVILVMGFNWSLILRKWKKYYLIRAAQFSIPLLPFLLINWLQLYGDRFVLEWVLDLKSVGVYSLLITLIGLLPLALDAVVNGIRPFLFEYFKDGVQKNLPKIHQLYQLFFSFCLLAASGIILVGANIHLFTSNPDYLQILPFLCLATLVFFLRCYTSLFYLNLLYVKQSSTLSFLSIGLAMVLFIGLFTLIPQLGIWGAIWANLGGNLFMIAGLAYFSRQRFYVPLPWKTVLLLPALFFLMLMTCEWAVKVNYWSYSLMGMAQFVLTCGLLFSLNFRDISAYMSKAKK